MNAWIATPSVILKPSVPMLLAITLVLVNLGTLEMEMYVSVSLLAMPSVSYRYYL